LTLCLRILLVLEPYYALSPSYRRTTLILLLNLASPHTFHVHDSVRLDTGDGIQFIQENLRRSTSRDDVRDIQRSGYFPISLRALVMATNL